MGSALEVGLVQDVFDKGLDLNVDIEVEVVVGVQVANMGVTLDFVMVHIESSCLVEDNQVANHYLVVEMYKNLPDSLIACNLEFSGPVLISGHPHDHIFDHYHVVCCLLCPTICPEFYR